MSIPMPMQPRSSATTGRADADERVDHDAALRTAGQDHPPDQFLRPNGKMLDRNWDRQSPDRTHVAAAPAVEHIPVVSSGPRDVHPVRGLARDTRFLCHTFAGGHGSLAYLSGSCLCLAGSNFSPLLTNVSHRFIVALQQGSNCRLKKCCSLLAKKKIGSQAFVKRA